MTLPNSQEFIKPSFINWAPILLQKKTLTHLIPNASNEIKKQKLQS